MDTQPPAKVDVSGKIEEIRRHMPQVYECIQEKARQIGNGAYELVRRGLRGERGCFYAFEAGRVVGTPFHGHPIMKEVGQFLVEFGCAHVCIWPDVPPVVASKLQGGEHGPA